MANTAVRLYRSVKKDGRWTFLPAGDKPKRLSEGAYYISWYVNTKKKMLRVGTEPDAALAALSRKKAELKYVANGGEVKQPLDANRTRIDDAVSKYVEDSRISLPGIVIPLSSSVSSQPIPQRVRIKPDLIADSYML